MYLYNFFIRITLNNMAINEDYLINYSSGINKILSQSKIIPILVIDDLDDGLRAGFFSYDDLVELPMIGEIIKNFPKNITLTICSV